jgi:hypothetical protein
MREDKVSKKSKMHGLTTCKYALNNELNKIILEIECEGCTESSSIENPICRKGILTAMRANTNVNAIITTHYREAQYVDASLEVLKEMCTFIDNIDKMAMRDPYSEFFEKQVERRKDHTKVTCTSCPLYPDAFFSELKENVMKSFVDTYITLDKMATQYQKFQPNKAECTKCKNLLSQDIVYLFNQIEDMRATILNRGFQILI